MFTYADFKEFIQDNIEIVCVIAIPVVLLAVIFSCLLSHEITWTPKEDFSNISEKQAVPMILQRLERIEKKIDNLDRKDILL